MSTELLLPQVTMPGLSFREWQAGDAAALARFMTTPEYNRWLAVKLQSVAEIDVVLKRHLARQKSRNRRHFRLCAVDAGTGELIADGFIWLLGGGAAEVGWGVDPTVWDTGAGTMMGEVLCAMAIERLDATEVWCKVMAPNLASARIAAKLGFSMQRTVMPGSTGLNRAHDIEIYRLLAEEYFERGYAI